VDFWTIVVGLFLALFGRKKRKRTAKQEMQRRALERFAIDREFIEYRVAKSRAKLGKELRRRARELKREVFGSH
jgi:hypothetical protein